MKKILFLFAVITIGFLCACNNEKIETARTETIESDTNITTILESYNAALSHSFTYTRAKDSQSKKGISKGRLWVIVAADMGAGIPAFVSCIDLAGKILAVTGGTAGPATAAAILAATGFIAGGASYGAYLTTAGCSISKVSQDYLDLTKDNNSVALKLNSMLLENQHISFNNNKVTINNDSIYLLIGQIHNDILNELVSPTPATFSTPFPPIKNDVDFIPANKQPQVLFKNSYGLTVYSNSNIEDLTKKIIIEDNTSFTNNSNYLEALSSYKDKGDITELQCNILSLFYEAFNDRQKILPTWTILPITIYTQLIRVENSIMKKNNSYKYVSLLQNIALDFGMRKVFINDN